LPRSEQAERVAWIVEALRAVLTSGTDPFVVDVKAQIDTLGESLSPEDLEEVMLDVQALNLLSKVVELQDDWVRYKASSMYVDPLLIELKIRASTVRELAEAFARSWHPIIKVEQVTRAELARAVRYWDALLPLGRRFREELGIGGALTPLDTRSLADMGILSKELGEKIEEIRRELEGLLGLRGEVDYWEFLRRRGPSEAVERALALSYVISSGFAGIELKPLEGRVLIVRRARGPRSIAISITGERVG